MQQYHSNKCLATDEKREVASQRLPLRLKSCGHLWKIENLVKIRQFFFSSCFCHTNDIPIPFLTTDVIEANCQLKHLCAVLRVITPTVGWFRYKYNWIFIVFTTSDGEQTIKATHVYQNDVTWQMGDEITTYCTHSM